jgi:hypothetical protein
MSDELLVRQCAPTLAGVKTGSMFSCRFESVEELYFEIRRVNRILVPKGLCLLPLRVSGKRALIYMYRPAELSRDLRDETAESLLKNAGYRGHTGISCVAELAQRFRSCGDFPHEVGLFLSYPPGDVKGFIENDRGSCKCSGMWKVFTDEERAERMFAKFREYTEVCCVLWRSGFSLEQLAVAK